MFIKFIDPTSRDILSRIIQSRYRSQIFTFEFGQLLPTARNHYDVRCFWRVRRLNNEKLELHFWKIIKKRTRGTLA